MIYFWYYCCFHSNLVFGLLFLTVDFWVLVFFFSIWSFLSSVWISTLSFRKTKKCLKVYKIWWNKFNNFFKFDAMRPFIMYNFVIFHIFFFFHSEICCPQFFEKLKKSKKSMSSEDKIRIFHFFSFTICRVKILKKNCKINNLIV